MLTATLAKAVTTPAANCTTGTWQQQWNCGLHNNVNVGAGLAHTASTFPLVALLVVGVLAMLALARMKRAGVPVTRR